MCITHLPQIACFADRHLTVRKTVSGNNTQTTVQLMDGEQRINELAEMIGGSQITATTLAQVKELIEAASSPQAAKPGRPGAAKQSMAAAKKGK